LRPAHSGSLQGLSIALASALARSRAVSAHIDGAARIRQTRKTPAYEDAWLGYAVAALLAPPSITPGITSTQQLSYTSLSAAHFFDDLKFSMTNLTAVVHWRGGSKGAKTSSNTHTARMRAAHDFARRHPLRGSHSAPIRPHGDQCPHASARRHPLRGSHSARVPGSPPTWRSVCSAVCTPCPLTSADCEALCALQAPLCIERELRLLVPATHPHMRLGQGIPAHVQGLHT